ncbi:MAG TPA: glycosyltransferase family 39 protein [Candidatus Paceibacterota bacterium]
MNYLRKHAALAGVLVALMLLGGLLRLWDLGEQSLWIDEGFTMNAALSVHEKGLPILESGEFYRNGILSVYMITFVEKVFGIDPFSPWPERLPAVVFGTGLIVAAYFFYREIFKDKVGALILSGAIAFSYWEIAWSRQARGYAMCSLFITVALTFLWRYSNSKRPCTLALAITGAILAYVSQESALAFILIVGLMVVIFAHDSKMESASRSFAPAAALAALFGISMLAQAFLPNMRPLRFDDYFNSLPPELLVSMCGAVTAWIWTLRARQDRRAVSFLALAGFSSLVLILFFSPAAQSRYLFPLFPIFIALTVYLARNAADYVFKGLGSCSCVLIALALLAALYAPFLNLLPRSTYYLESGSPQPDFKTAYDLIRKNKKEGDIIISGFTQMHNVYLGEKGMWLKMNFNGPASGADAKVINGFDYYVAAPIIVDFEQLKKVLGENTGYLVLDSMTDSRWPEIYPYFETCGCAQKIISDRGAVGGASIYVYKF